MSSSATCRQARAEADHGTHSHTRRLQLLGEIKTQERCVLLKHVAIVQSRQEHIMEQQGELLRALKVFAVGFEVAGAMRKRTICS